VVEEDILEAEINYCYPHDLKESLIDKPITIGRTI
jgi:hypothetical protein